MDIKKAVGSKVRAFRSRRGFTQQELAKRIDLSAAAVRSFERGISAPSFKTLERLTKALGVPARDFFDFGNGVEELEAKRLELTNALSEAARHLDDDKLELATALVETLSQRQRRKPPKPAPVAGKLRDIVVKNLRFLRAQRGMSQEQLAFDASVHRTYIGMIERQASSPTIEMIERLSKALDVDPVAFFEAR